MPRKNRRGKGKKESRKDNQLLDFTKSNPREDWEKMDKSLTALDVAIIENAVMGEQARNLKALHLLPKELEAFPETGKYAKGNWDCALGGG